VVPEDAENTDLEVDELLRHATGESPPRELPVQTPTTVWKELPVVSADRVMSEPGVNWYQTVLLLSKAQVGLGSPPSSVAAEVSTEVENGRVPMVAREAK
jgi:hypothetical protein